MLERTRLVKKRQILSEDPHLVRELLLAAFPRSSKRERVNNVKRANRAVLPAENQGGDKFRECKDASGVLIQNQVSNSQNIPTLGSPINSSRSKILDESPIPAYCNDCITRREEALSRTLKNQIKSPNKVRINDDSSPHKRTTQEAIIEPASRVRPTGIEDEEQKTDETSTFSHSPAPTNNPGQEEPYGDNKLLSLIDSIIAKEGTLTTTPAI
jgi:hypothetical protein